MTVFWRKGYEGASLSDLTTAMGINAPIFLCGVRQQGRSLPRRARALRRAPQGLHGEGAVRARCAQRGAQLISKAWRNSPPTPAASIRRAAFWCRAARAPIRRSPTKSRVIAPRRKPLCARASTARATKAICREDCRSRRAGALSRRRGERHLHAGGRGRDRAGASRHRAHGTRRLAGGGKSGRKAETEVARHGVTASAGDGV